MPACPVLLSSSFSVNTREKIFVKWRDGSVTMPVATYPGLYYRDDSGKWKTRQQPRGVPRIDASCLETKTSGLGSPQEAK